LIIPALNEERSLPHVLAQLPIAVHTVIVVDNGSTDDTAEVAKKFGAIVVSEPRRGYGSACLAGIRALPADAEIVAFVDADFSDHPSDLDLVMAPIERGEADLVIGSRVLGTRERGALLPQARVGNWLAATTIHLLFGHRYTDLGPMRAVRRGALDRLGMRDLTFGWTVEMQVRALLSRLRVLEVPVSYRRRIGRSKITGTLKGTLLAGWKILSTIIGLRLGIVR
jgi:glycosyltransferase involved in cell wall biosynthesis